MIHMFCLYHFSLKCIIKNLYLFSDDPLKLLDRAVSGDIFLNGGVFECDIAHRLSVAVLCMQHKISCNLISCHHGAHLMVLYLDNMCQCGLHAVLRLQICILMHHLSVPRLIYPSQCPSGMILLTLYDGVGLAGFKSKVNAFLLA